MIDGIAIKGTGIISLFQLQKQTPQQLHSNHIGVEKMELLVHESVCWLTMNAGIGSSVKQCAPCPDYQQMQLHVKTIPHEIPSKPWVIVAADVFSIDN